MKAKWLLFVVFYSTPLFAADWPQFRGPTRDGVSTETGLPLEWNGTTNIVWKTEMPGPGTSSPIVFGDRVYVTCYSGYGIPPKGGGKMADLKRHLVCVDRVSGKILWNEAVQTGTDADPPYGEGSMIALHGYASHTPTADKSGVYAYFGSAGAVGYSHTGEKKWQLTLGDKSRLQEYGSAASPILYENLFIVNAAIETAKLYEQGETVAIDTQSGKVIWREKAGSEWSSPILATVGGKTELVTASHYPNPWVGLDPATGKRLWECRAKDGCGTPVFHNGVAYTFSGEGKTAIRTGGRGNVAETHKVWESSGGARITSPVYHDGHLYWSSDGHTAHCAEAGTGKSVYRERLGKGGDCYASPVVADGRIYHVSRQNGTFVVAASPEYKLLAHNKIEDDKSVFNGSPAVSGGQIFLRSDGYLYCIGKK